MRAVIYARYSSENQREASIDDQIEVCRRYIDQQQWTVVNSYADRAISGASDRRPEYQKMIADAELGSFDVIVCEALDRLGRRLSEVARLHDQLEFRGVKLHAVNLGRVTPMHVGLLGTMAQLYLSDLKEKTRRGQLGRALAGKIPGGKAYGYKVLDGRSGERQIIDDEASIVRRVFHEFATGKSARAIAKGLNADGIPGPDGREWRDTTIRGQVDRGTGILNNAIYIGRLEWNRCSYVKDPRTGKRVARPNPKALWELVSIPELRIVSDDVWNAAKSQQQERCHEVRRADIGNPLNRVHRRKFLFSGLLKCGRCGGGYTIVAQDRYGCATRRSKGTCDNSATVDRQEIERRVFEGLKAKLLAPELVREFAQTFQEEMNRAAIERDQQFNTNRQHLAAVERKVAAIVSAIEDGGYSRTLGDRLSALEREKESLTALVAAGPAPVLRIHPRLADVYAEKVAKLEVSLNDPAIRHEASDLIRSLISEITLRPREDEGGVDAVLHGDLATILAFCDAGEHKSKLPGARAPGSSLSVVAGIGFEPMTFRL
jgi:site-specific DNA recombinase